LKSTKFTKEIFRIFGKIFSQFSTTELVFADSGENQIPLLNEVRVSARSLYLRLTEKRQVFTGHFAAVKNEREITWRNENGAQLDGQLRDVSKKAAAKEG
jgi:hypothetical protein